MAEHVELSERDSAILHLLSTGHTQPEIAGQVATSVRTVAAVIRSLSDVLAARNVTHMVANAIRANWIE